MMSLAKRIMLMRYAAIPSTMSILPTGEPQTGMSISLVAVQAALEL